MNRRIAMIRIHQQVVKPEDLSEHIPNSEHKTIVKQMATYHQVYQYYNLQHLNFELNFRSNTMKAAQQLNDSGVKFTTFRYAFPNKAYWNRLSNGGFLLKHDARPSTAILDILKNGKLYAFECSTAIAIVLYIATLYSIGHSRFDGLFTRLYLMDWQFDDDLPIHQKYGDDYLPGDVLHFNNPDFDPKQPHWRAENVVYFGDDKYYGHGVGIRNASTIINFLNKKRKPNPKTSAYLMNMITRPEYSAFL